MSYRALYRVWRPGTFSEVVGQSHISQTLKNAIIKDRVSHAYLFAGPRGTGKTSLAKIMGKIVNCVHPDNGEPCNQCSNCLAINDGSFMDYFEIDAASNRGIDEIRDMREKVKFSPSQGKTKVYVIDEVHMLTNEAFNALLKTLEEPPPHVMFILATTEAQKIPATILSRCQRYDFKKIHESGIAERLTEIIEKENITVDSGALALIVKKAEGGMRDAISILDQAISASDSSSLTLESIEEVLGTISYEQLELLFSHLFKGNISDALSVLQKSLDQGRDAKQIVKDMIDFIREIILYKVSLQSDTSKDNHISFRELSSAGSLVYFNDLLHKLIDVEQKMFYFSRPGILLETALIGFTVHEKDSSETKLSKEKNSQPENKNKKKDNAVVVACSSDNNPSTMEPVIKAKNADNSFVKKEDKIIWEDVLAQVKKEKITLHACLIAGKFSIEDGLGYIVFDSGKTFHQERVALKENIDFLEKIIESKTNKPLKIRSVLKQDKKADHSNQNQETYKNNEEEFDVINEAIKIFSPDIVESKDS